MCGRSRCSLAPERVEEVTGVPRERWVDADRFQPSYNVQPGRWTPILRLDEQQLPILQTMKWGLVPSFTKAGETPDHFKMFNARSETVTEKPIFSRLLPQQRCVVILDGFYEWKADAGGKKQPYYVSFGEGEVMRMAGLYDVWSGGPDGPMATYTILTVDASPKLAWLHNRMPVLLPDDDAVAAWLNGSSNTQQQQHQQHQQQQHETERAAEVKSSSSSKSPASAEAATAAKGSAFKLVNQVCTPCSSDMLTWHPVTPAMSKPSYDSPDCCEDVRTKKGNISSFFKPQGAAGGGKTAAAGKAPMRQQEQQQQHDNKSPTQAAAAAAAAHREEGLTPTQQQQQQPQQQQQKQQQPHAASSPASTKKGRISSFFKPLASPARKDQQEQQQEGAMQQAGTVRNTDEQKGPSAGDNAAAAAAAKKKKSTGSGSKRTAAATKAAGLSTKKMKSMGT